MPNNPGTAAWIIVSTPACMFQISHFTDFVTELDEWKTKTSVQTACASDLPIAIFTV
jgi:hypothetical protein